MSRAGRVPEPLNGVTCATRATAAFFAMFVATGCLQILKMPFSSGSSSSPRSVTNPFLLSSSECARPPDRQAGQYLASDLIALGSSHLATALSLAGTPTSESLELPTAIDCFGRALRLVPESYEASLGMGIAYLAGARFLDKKEAERDNFLSGARNMLGHAYTLRHGAYEPLYYLAEVALVEGKLVLARQFLIPLQSAGVKEGPVNMLMGRLSELEGKKQEAVGFYRKAISIGWPHETTSYSSTRVAELAPPPPRSLKLVIKCNGAKLLGGLAKEEDACATQ
jgi:tetratricopeptide (TPR) repeat protein